MSCDLGTIFQAKRFFGATPTWSTVSGLATNLAWRAAWRSRCYRLRPLPGSGAALSRVIRAARSHCRYGSRVLTEEGVGAAAARDRPTQDEEDV